MDGRKTDRRPDEAGVLRVARHLEAFGRSRSRLALLETAKAADTSAEVLKACFWAALKVADFLAAERCLTEIAGQDATDGDPWLPRARQRLDSLRPIDPAAYEARLELLRPRRAGPTRLAGAGGAQQAGAIPDAGRRRICYVLSGSLPWMQTGYAMRSHALIEALRKAGADLHCLTRPGFPADRWGLDETADYPPRSEVGGVVYHHIREPSRKVLKRGAWLDAAAEALTLELAALNPGVVMAASDHHNALPALIAARRLGRPFVYDVRGFWELSRVAEDPTHAGHPDFATAVALESLTAREADLVLTLTGAMRDELVRRGADPARIALAPNACDPARHAPRPRDPGLSARLALPGDVPVIGYIGSFNGYEGLDDLVRACGGLKRRGLAFRLLLVGRAAEAEGPSFEDQLRQVAAAEGLADWLILPGQVPRDEVEAWYSLIDIAPFPRRALAVTELVSPMKPLEALAMGKAVLVSDLAPLAEMIADGRTGLVVRRDDPAALEAGLVQLVGDPGLRLRLGRAGRRWVLLERTWDGVARRARTRIEALLPVRD